jgi:cyclopropane-fatty-acyl-phospholipid synthase
VSSRAYVEVGRRGRLHLPLWRRLAESWAGQCPCGQITVVFPDGDTVISRGSKPGPSARIELHNSRPVWRILTRGDIGFAEAFMAGDWSTPDLTAVIEFGLRNESALADKMRGSWMTRFMAALRFRLQANSRSGARRNIAYHYDLGNDFYAAWLDETMTYSSAIFASPHQPLADAQREKYRRIVETLRIQPGDRVLEIGCGWGGFAEYAAREAGGLVTAITLSQEQARYARHRIAQTGLADRVEIRVEDYRDVLGEFDKIVSIEMFEAVGEANWGGYFDVVHARLVVGGLALLQVIVVPDERFPAYRQHVDFIQRYIFPGGMLPSPAALSAAIRTAGLKLGDGQFFGLAYAETLRQWHERFQHRWEAIAAFGFDERFRRMWTYYLNSCEACFRTGATDVGHFLIRK